jgi:hypothetical protein
MTQKALRTRQQLLEARVATRRTPHTCTTYILLRTAQNDSIDPSRPMVYTKEEKVKLRTLMSKMFDRIAVIAPRNAIPFTH